MDLKYNESEVLAASTEYFNGDELAAKTFSDKYAVSKYIDGQRMFAELTPFDMHKRMAAEFARVDAKLSPDNPTPENVFFLAMENFRHIVPQGSVMYGCGNPYAKVSLSNCVVVASPEDSITGIMNTGRDLANLFKRRAGVGVDISSLRPCGAAVSNAAATSTGAYSFAELYSNICRQISMNGRRGALMISISAEHPDVELFAKMKRDLTKVTGANVSIMIPDAFMEAVERDGEWITHWPIELPVDKAKVTRVFKARELWATINESAWLSAEPGLLFADNYKRNLPAHFYPGFEFLSVNPCAELPLSAYDACRLISMNLVNFVDQPYTKKASFDFVKFKQYVRLAQRMSDDLVELEIEALTNIIDNLDDQSEIELWTKLRDSAVNGRRTGLGTHGLADTFCALGITYGSKESLELVAKIYAEFRDSAYDESIELAKERGVFPTWESGSSEEQCDFLKRLPGALRHKMRTHGRRNISLLTMAPTGSVAILSQTSSGIEPIFALSYTRRKKINPSDTTSVVDFTDKLGDKWQHFTVRHHAVNDYIAMNGESDLPPYFVTADQVDIEARLKMSGIIQSYIDHGISQTLNLPTDTSIETIETIYLNAWKQGLKGVTVYRDGCRSGVLVTSTSSPEKIQSSKCPKRPKALKCSIHRVSLKTKAKDDPEDWTFLVGFLDDQPYEIFGGPSEAIELPKRATAGQIVKRKCEKGKSRTGRTSCYDLVVGEGDDELKIRDIAAVFSPDDEDYGLMTRLVSQELRHGVPIEHIVDQLSRSDKAALNSFSKVMARVLKKFIHDGAKSGEKCESCGAKLVFSEGCVKCPQCGASKCS